MPPGMNPDGVGHRTHQETSNGRTNSVGAMNETRKRNWNGEMRRNPHRAEEISAVDSRGVRSDRAPRRRRRGFPIGSWSACSSGRHAGCLKASALNGDRNHEVTHPDRRYDLE
jgi:hypothetical protein